MKEAKFKVGEKVLTCDGQEGEVLDVFEGKNSHVYTVIVHYVNGHDTLLFFESELEKVPEPKEFSMDIKIDIASNVVIATLYESVGGALKVLSKGHGHIIHEGELGIAQAASYACNRLWRKIGGFDK